MNDLSQAKKLIKECQETQNPYLDLGNCGITDLKELPELFECTHLETLILSNCWEDYKGKDDIYSRNYGEKNSISSIPDEISNLKKLSKLIICGEIGSNWKISDISFLKKMTGLQSLDLSRNNISEIRLENLTELKILNFQNNIISDIKLSNLTGLHSLDLRNNRISDIKLSNLIELKYLDLWNNRITDTSFLEKLIGLHSLNLGFNKIFDFRFFIQLSGLLSLNLSRNQISNICVENLTNLKSLNLEKNEITAIRLENLPGLQTLYISKNNISDISFENLPGLQTLDIRDNKISDIRFLEKLTELKILNFQNNIISDIKLSNLTGLQRLDLRENKIIAVRLENFPGLQTLDLSDNKITAVRLENLANLKTLNLEENKITDIHLENLPGLQTLDLRDNKISDISFLSNLTGLQTLDLKNNQLKEIPPFIFQLNMEINMEEYGYRGLRLYGNLIESPPLEILNQGRQSVLDWFEAKKQKLNEIKIILIGEPKAGKTSLLKRLKDNSFNEMEVQTDGVNIEDIAFGKSDTFKEQKSLHKITGHFWDFGGQEIMNATHQFFLTKRSVYVLVLDARKDANNSEQIRHWVQRIRATGSDSPIIVLANQSDVNPGFGFENERELNEEFPQINHFIKISCKTNENIDLFKNKLAELIPTAELFKTEIDERWMTIKNKLQEETKQKYYLNESRFIEICDEAGLTEKDGQKNTIKFLHDLGLVLHFDDLNLSEYYVLNPYWITYGAYQILTSKLAGEAKGVVSMDKLEYIVNEEEDKKESYQPANYKKIKYSTNDRRFLIDILNEFKLCFRSPDGNHFIIPDLLDTTELSTITDPIRNSDKSIQFVYEYDYLPKSVMPNMMVEMHPLLKSMWRTGCIFEYYGCKALLTSYQNRISIIVTGEHKKKREFMANIRYIIDLTNQKLSNKSVPKIPLPGVNGYVDYEILLTREQKGRTEYIFDEDKSTERHFSISELLDGIPRNIEVENNGQKFQNEVLAQLKNLKDGQDEIISSLYKLNSHYDHLMSLECNNKIMDEIQKVIEEAIEIIQILNDQQTAEISDEIMARIGTFENKMSEEQKKIYTDLKQTGNVQAKVKVAVPFINYLGINVGVEATFDVKKVFKKIFKRDQ